jgi:hypothetical protein
VNKNTDGLKAHADEVRLVAQRKALEAIDELVVAGKKVTYNSVSATSGVSRTTLYNNIAIKRRIEEIKSAKTDVAIEILKEQNARLKLENQQLREEKKMLIVQLVHLDSLSDENERLKGVISRMQR